ncbi:Coenzyme F420 hydrogenase/dehydrogenase, beta subunit C-terminal domain, partial [Blautia hydrogenotrophica]|uniref:Coenzyme F420 hydrogenase/dehydrogenase, beta subunit C-terminal domain n=1 Tax=Blautia hydrogenotrophica TaxID=53443 RepID=UPI00258AEA2B
YLRKPYENLYVCEILCHAAPSPKILRKYLDYLENKFKSKVVDVIFRDKSETGWLIHRTQLVVKFENGQVLRVNARKNNYFRAFLNDYISRECCNHCEYVYDHRKGDLTIGDFWGIQHLM